MRRVVSFVVIMLVTFIFRAGIAFAEAPCHIGLVTATVSQGEDERLYFK